MTERPVERHKAASAFYKRLGWDVSYHGAIWHSYKVGHLLMADLDRICQRRGLSMADVHLLGLVRLGEARSRRATDMALRLHVSNAVLSTRVAKLERKGLLLRIPCPDDRRALMLELTPEGVAALDWAIEAVDRHSTFVKRYRALSEEDRAALTRIMGELHDQLDRDFIA